jgi:hypothetical protein
MENCGDKHYTSFSSINGYNIRMSPKVFTNSVDRIPRSEKDILSEFIQNPGVMDPRTEERVLYVGDQDNIDPHLEEFVDLIQEVQQFVLKQPNLAKRMLSNDDSLLRDVGQFYSSRYTNMKHRRDDSEAKKWAENPLGCEEIRSINL